VENVTAVQMPGAERRVQIQYDISDADSGLCTVWVLAGRVVDDEVPAWDIPAITLTGTNSIGPNVTTTPTPVRKTVIWDAGADIPGIAGRFRIRVYADDGNGMANMVFVAQDAQYSLGGYWIDKYEVTNQRYCEYLNSVDAARATAHYDSQMEITKKGSVYTVNEGRQNYPLRYVSYNDAVDFALWLSQREGRTYRLPSADEWYKAAAWDPVAKKHWTYGFQRDTIDCDWCVYNGTSCGNNGPRVVGYFNGKDGRNDARSYYGCYDMSGNLWEWTSQLSGSYRVIRGGGWYHNANGCACSNRDDDAPSARNGSLGFRLVLDLEE